MKRTDARRLSPEAQEAIRLRVVDFLRMKKGTQGEAAAIFQLSLACVKKIWKQYKEGGRKALKVKKRGPQQHCSPFTKTAGKASKNHDEKGHTGWLPDSFFFVDSQCGTVAA